MKEDVSQYVRVEFVPENIFSVTYLKAIPDSDLDIKISEYISYTIINEVSRMGIKDMMLFVDISKYERLDCSGISGVTYPCMGARKKNSEGFKNNHIKKVAFYSEKGNKALELIIKSIHIYGKAEVKVFNDSEKAMSWLRAI